MFAGSHEDRRFAPPSRNTTQLAQAVPEFSHSGTVTRGKFAYRKRPTAFFCCKTAFSSYALAFPQQALRRGFERWLNVGVVDRANRGNRRGVLFFQTALIDPVLCSLSNHARKNQDRYTIRDSHKSVGNIGEVPNQVATTDAAPEYKEQEHHLIRTDPLVPNRYVMARSPY